jgi:hypothetical protein
VSTCDECGRELDDHGYRVGFAALPGRFHALACAQKAFVRYKDEQRLIVAYGSVEAAKILRAARGEEPVPQPQGDAPPPRVLA